MKKILVYGVSNEIGGIEAFFINILSHLNDTSLSFDFITSSSAACQYEKKIIENGGKNFKITSWSKNPVAHNKEIKELLKKSDYDYIWVNATSASNISIYKNVKKSTKAKLIIHSHGSAFESKNTGLKFKILKKLHFFNKKSLINYGDVLFASSKEASSWLFGDDRNVEIIKNGIDIKRFLFNSEIRKKIREELDISNKKVLINIGRLEDVKNQFFLLDIVSQLSKVDNNIVLLLIGEGSLENILKEKIGNLNLNKHVILLGFRSNIEDYLTASDLFILPSKSEGLSIAAIEAQSAGLTCLVSDNVPLEINVTEKVNYMSLDEPIGSWVNKIMDLFNKENNRLEMSFAVEQSGFSIQNTVDVIKNILVKEGKINE